jgi:hypothetical protein
MKDQQVGTSTDDVDRLSDRRLPSPIMASMHNIVTRAPALKTITNSISFKVLYNRLFDLELDV